MSTQSEAKAHLDSVADAARSHKAQEERIRELEAELCLIRADLWMGGWRADGDAHFEDEGGITASFCRKIVASIDKRLSRNSTPDSGADDG